MITGCIRSIPAHRLPLGKHLAAARSRPAQRTPAPVRRPPRRTPAHRPATADPSRPIANPGPNTRTPCPNHTAPHAASTTPTARAPSGQRLQPRHRLGPVTRTHRGELAMARAVMVERVGHIRQPHLTRRPSPLPSSRPTPPPSRRSAPGVFPDTTNVDTGGSRLRRRSNHIRCLLNHHMRIRAADPERRHPGPARTTRQPAIPSPASRS